MKKNDNGSFYRIYDSSSLRSSWVRSIKVQILHPYFK